MSVRTDVINLNVNVNGNKAQSELNNLRKKAADVKFEMEGLKKGTDAYLAKKAELKQITDEMAKLKKQIGLTSLTQKELIRELNTLKALRGSVIPFSDEYKQLSKSIKEVENRLYDVKNGVQGFSSFFSKIKDEVKQFGVAAAAYLGFEFISSQFRSIISGAGKLSDSLADIRRVTGLTAEETKNLNAQLTSLDTRTSTAGLREIAIIAGKLGVAKNDIFGFTTEVDKLVVALGDELGNADQITTQLGKILNVFDGKVNADNISRLGNSFVELANAGVASGGFIADFTQRVAGVAKASGLSLGATVGLGAGLEELGQRSESSATAIQKLLNNIASDIPKAAKIAGVDVKKFAELFANSPQEALIKFAEGLTKNKASFAEIASSFKDAGEEGARVVDVLQALGQKGDFLREKIELGNKSLKETTAINEAFALKNETFGATLDKLGKEFNKLVTSPAVTNFLKGAVEGALNFIKAILAIPAPIIKAGAALTTLIVGIALFRSSLIQSAIVSLYESGAIVKNTAIKIYNTVVTKGIALAEEIATRARLAAIIVTELFTGKIKIATAATQLWSYVLKGSLGPISLVISAVALIGGAVYALVKAFDSSSKQINYHTETLRIANQEIAKEKSQLDSLTAVVKDNAISLNTRKESLAKLIAISPEYLGRLTLENIATNEGRSILDQYNKALETNANLKAANTIKDREFAKGIELRTIKQELEIAKASRNFDGLSEKAQEIFRNAAGKRDFNNTDFIGAQFTAALKEVDKQIEKQTANVNASTDNYLAKTKEQENSRKQFLLGDVTALRADMNSLEKGTDAYKKAAEKYEAARQKYFNEFGSGTKTDKKSGDISIPQGEEEKKAAKAAERDRKRMDKERENLKKDADKFYDELLKLKRNAEIKGEEPEEAEIQRVKEKYSALIAKAKEFFLQSAITKKQYNEDEKLIEEAQRIELNNIFQKYYKKRFEESSANEYEQSLTARREYADDLKIQVAKEYADGKIGKDQYEKALKKIERDETSDRIIIANDYSKTVKKAAVDGKNFKKQQEKETTQDAIDESEKRKEVAAQEALSKAKRNVLISRPGSDARLQANKDLLQLQFEQETAFLDKKSELYLLKQAELNEALKELDKQATLDKIDNIMQYVGFFQDALNSLNQFITNRENAQFAKEKAANDKKKKSYKDQLDNKLISQGQYDKKINQVNEDQDRKERELKRKQAEREKSLNIFNAFINNASAIVKTMTSVPFPFNIPLAIAQGIAGGLQIAAIKNAPLPELGKGDWFTTGDKHSDPSGGIPVKIERDEAVISAAAMTDKNRYTVTGTTAQITSALNSKAGGIKWAGGAVVKMAGSSRINPELPRIMAQGGTVRSITENQSNDSNSETNLLLKQLIAKQVENTEELKNMKTKLHAVVSIKEYREQEKLYDAAKKASGF